jgi:hypothetical protein
MKNCINTILSLSGAGLLLLASCKKDESKVTFNGGTAPVLTSTATDSIALPLSDTTATAVTFNWTNPNYTFSDGVSSQNVQYLLEFDTTTAFNSANLTTIGIANGLTVTYSVAQFNAIMANGLLLSTGSKHTVQARVQAFIRPFTSGTLNAIDTLSSSPLSFTVNPYALPPAVAPPASDTLYITGSATNKGWMVGGDITSVAGQGLHKVNGSDLIWSITLPLIGGQQFLLVPVAGDWGNKYATANGSSANTGGTFGLNASNNFNGPVAGGTYTVTFNFQTGNYSITQ